MYFYELEDRLIAWFDPDTALLFDGGTWRKGSEHLARKATLDGTKLSLSDLWSQFPRGAAGFFSRELGDLMADEAGDPDRIRPT